jgi:hypothetical protein
MQRQECALHPNECNGGNLPGSLSHATSKEGAKRVALFGVGVERKHKGNGDVSAATRRRTTLEDSFSFRTEPITTYRSN